MEPKNITTEFSGFGPITSSKTTFSQGIGMGGSFAPAWTNEPKIPQKTASVSSVSAVSYPFMLEQTSSISGGTITYSIQIYYGEIAGVPPDGMTRESDYIITPQIGTSCIYLIITFDGNGIITSRTIGYGSSIPGDTDDTKYMLIGVVISSSLTSPYSIYQNLSQDVYTEKATYINEAETPSNFFADSRKINLTNINETFVVDANGEDSITRVYLKDTSNAEYIELKKDSENGVVSIDGFAGSGIQNFLISSNDESAQSKINLYDSGSETFIGIQTDSSNSEASIYGYSGSAAQNFVLKSDSDSELTQLTLFDSQSAQYLFAGINSINGSSSVHGYAENETFNFELKADKTANSSSVRVYGQNSNVYAQMQTEQGKSSVYGYAQDHNQNYILKADENTSVSQLQLFDTNNANFFSATIDSQSIVSVFGYSQNEAHNFELKCDSTTGESKISVFDAGSSNYLESKIATNQSQSSVYGYAGNQSQNFRLKADAIDSSSTLELFDEGSGNFVTLETKGAGETGVYGYYNQENYFKLNGKEGESQLTLWSDSNACYVKLKATQSETSLYGYTSSESEYFILKAKNEDTRLYLSSGGAHVDLDIPDNNGTLINAEWREIDVCVNGESKKMQVFGTEPY